MEIIKRPAVLLVIGILIGIVFTEAVFFASDPIIPKEGSFAIVTDSRYYPNAREAIASAKESVHIAMFSANYQTSPDYSDSSVNRLLGEVINAQNKGLEVKVVMDDWPEGNEKAARYLHRNNVDVRVYSGEGTLHAKLIIIDGAKVIVGSSNWSYHSLEKNHEANLLMNNRRLGEEFEEYFSSLYLSSSAFQEASS